jgi:murein DD-endopeptidase MepM/ murein hydrolase activator NlpD
VLAVADATVTEVLDELDDQVPGSLPDPATITFANVDGNHFTLDLGQGLYAFYTHLKNGSLRGTKGNRVKRGQELGRLGNSGNTSAPHLHLHVMTTPSDSVPHTLLGYYVDRLIKDGGRWYFKERQIHVNYVLEGRKFER